VWPRGARAASVERDRSGDGGDGREGQDER
jgi:hypothetical protein